MEIRFANENDFSTILEKIDLFFGKEKGYFTALVPTLYREGYNSFRNHIVAISNNQIVGVLAFKNKYLLLDKTKYKISVLGTICVDKNFRNQGVMSEMINYLFQNNGNIDCYALIGNPLLYGRFGFVKVQDSLLYNVVGDNAYFDFEKITNDSDLSFAKELYNSKKNRVLRDSFVNHLLMWNNEAYKIKSGTIEIGYLIYNPRMRIIEEIELIKDDFIVNAIKSFSCVKKETMRMKINKHNIDKQRYFSSFISERFEEKLLIKTSKKELENLFVLNADMI